MSGPGSWLRAFAALVCRSSTVERLVDPILSDLRIEYAAAAGRSWRRRGVLLRAYIGFWKALAIHTALSIGGRSEHGEQVVFRRVIAFSALGFALVTVLLVLPPLLDGFPGILTGKTRQVMLALTLIPQALPISIPIGVCLGIVTAVRARTLTLRDVLVTLTVGFTAACLVGAIIEWALPWGNQAFRDMTVAAVTDGRIVHVEPGLNELGFSGLARRTDSRAIRQYQLLWALTFAGIPLALFTLAAAARVRRTPLRVSLTLVTVFGYYEILWVSDRSLRQGAPALVVWAANLVFLAAGLVLMWRQSAVGKSSARIGRAC